MNMNVVSKEVKNIDGVIHEEIKVDHPCVGKVTFVYEGSENILDNFLKHLIFSYLRANKLID